MDGRWTTVFAADLQVLDGVPALDQAVYVASLPADAPSLEASQGGVSQAVHSQRPLSECGALVSRQTLASHDRCASPRPTQNPAA